VPLDFPTRPSDGALAERDAEVRRAVRDHRPVNKAEHALVEELIERREELLPDHPWLLAFEWDVVRGESKHGIGDLVFGDRNGRLVAVEAKYVPDGSGRQIGSARYKKRHKAWQQALTYAEILWRRVPWAAAVEARTWTNLCDEPRIHGRFGPLTEHGQVARAVQRACWSPSLYSRQFMPRIGTQFRLPTPSGFRLGIVTGLPQARSTLCDLSPVVAVVESASVKRHPKLTPWRHPELTPLRVFTPRPSWPSSAPSAASP
jgi:hypothetical protein